jgi:hypothetical protein
MNSLPLHKTAGVDVDENNALQPSLLDFYGSTFDELLDDT